MTVAKQKTPMADANPTKRFFVNMLTRDIDLGDAILDLLDNCIDGALRSNESKPPENLERPYQGLMAEITLNEKNFILKDNCGGMSLRLAEKYAFRFGRPDEERDEDIPTVGVYGIGMKRALFKLGTDCLIESHHENDHFSVHITPSWLSKDDNWNLPINPINSKTDHDGVSITINKLHPSIAVAFSKTGGNFGEHLRELVRTHYAYIIKKGFNVIINGLPVEPAEMRTLIDLTSDGVGIAPYVYETEHDGVSIQLVLGMYERFASDADLEEIEQGTRSKHTAGWTILCNDRVVVSHDTTRLTGWGDAGVPAYHSQFVAISGIVTFVSNDAGKLPVTTTKRGIDQNSELYASVKDVMREALTVFTKFTNKWKSQTQERTEIQKTTKSIDIRNAATAIPDSAWSDVRRGLKGRRFVPKLPLPEQAKTHSRISFTRPIEQINIITKYLFDPGETPKPSEVGEAAFDHVLAEAK